MRTLRSGDLRFFIVKIRQIACVNAIASIQKRKNTTTAPISNRGTIAIMPMLSASGIDSPELCNNSRMSIGMSRKNMKKLLISTKIEIITVDGILVFIL
jgi:hypothetical protein